MPVSSTFASISAAWIQGGKPLPTCCALHGEPATASRRLSIPTPAPAWLLALLIVGVVPFLVANYVVRKRVKAAAWPFCGRCRRERLIRLCGGLAVFAAGAVLAVLASQAGGDVEPGQTASGFGTPELLGIPGVLALLFGVFLARRGLWRHVAGTALTTDLKRVVVQPAHPAFVAAVAPEARVALPAPPAAAQR
jgi:hypothetical protein